MDGLGTIKEHTGWVFFLRTSNFKDNVNCTHSSNTKTMNGTVYFAMDG